MMMARVFIERIQLPEWTLLQLDCYTLLYINYLKQVVFWDKLQILVCSFLWRKNIDGETIL